MKAFEFINSFGLDEAKRVVEYRDKHASRTCVYTFNKPCADKAKLSGGAYLYTESYNEWSVSVDDLKRLVESHALVKDLYGLARAKEYCESEYTAPEVSERLKQAIADVESCL